MSVSESSTSKTTNVAAIRKLRPAYQPSSYRAPTKRVAVAVSSNHAQHTTISHRSSTERRLIHNSASAPPASTMIKPLSEERDFGSSECRQVGLFLAET